MSGSTFEVVRTRKGGAYVRLLASSGETLFHTETFDSVDKARATVHDIVQAVYGIVERTHSTTAPLYVEYEVRT
jgi:uncharacterized protein YegP (UPF0339 family)